MFKGTNKRTVMSKIKNLSTSALALSLTLSVLSAPACAEEDIMQLAHDSARMAGSATYCKADEELVDEYIGKMEGKIAALAKDDYQKVLASVEFKNIYTAMSAKEPEGGCLAFLPRFEKAVKDER